MEDNENKKNELESLKELINNLKFYIDIVFDDYKNDLKRSFEMSNQDNDKGLTMLSELNENMDKRIKESLISFLKSPFIRENITPMHVAPWINWLEKSDDKKYVAIDDVVDLLDRELINDKDEVTKEPFINFANAFHFKETFISNFKQKLLEDTYRKEIKNDILSLSLEKNEKETDNIDFTDCDDTTQTEEDILPENEETCNFKVGDLIVENNFKHQVLKIKEITEDGKVWFNNGTGTFIEFLNGYHLWTKEDIKEGDILYSPQYRCIWIYKDNKTFHAGISLNNPDNLVIDSAIEITSDTILADKETRDMLLNKLEDKGYVFDFEKNELKEKVNFKPGDWIVDKNCKIDNFLNPPKERILHILSCNEDGSYLCDSYDNYLRSTWFSKETIEKYKHWTIEDAMPGDIIVNGSTIIMYALINFKTVNVYCYVSNDVFYDDSDGSCGYYETIDSDFRPAELNEKRYFYKKMADAGYAWNHRNLVKIKIKSLFNIGDWIVNNESGKILRVLQVSDTNYKVSTLEGEQYDISKIIINNGYHKFTLRDLRPGDVIVDDEHNIGIFESIGHGEHGSFNDDTYCYCFGILYEGDYFYTDDGVMYDYDDVHPASKEEQERLFDKMKKSGYSWDDKNKEIIRML